MQVYEIGVSGVVDPRVKSYTHSSYASDSNSANHVESFDFFPHCGGTVNSFSLFVMNDNNPHDFVIECMDMNEDGTSRRVFSTGVSLEAGVSKDGTYHSGKNALITVHGIPVFRRVQITDRWLMAGTMTRSLDMTVWREIPSLSAFETADKLTLSKRLVITGHA